jgi:hypothetical protein
VCLDCIPGGGGNEVPGSQNGEYKDYCLLGHVDV